MEAAHGRDRVRKALLQGTQRSEKNHKMETKIEKKQKQNRHSVLFYISHLFDARGFFEVVFVFFCVYCAL